MSKNPFKVTVHNPMFSVLEAIQKRGVRKLMFFDTLIMTDFISIKQGIANTIFRGDTYLNKELIAPININPTIIVIINIVTNNRPVIKIRPVQ